MKTELDNSISTEIGPTRIRTLSHYLIVKKPRTTIFSHANPYSEATTLTILWNTADADALQTLHNSVVACFSEHGFSPFKEATQLLHSGVDTKATAGKVKLSMLLTREVAAQVKFIA